MCFLKKLTLIHLHFIILIIIFIIDVKVVRNLVLKIGDVTILKKKFSFEDDLNTKKQINDGHLNGVVMVKCDIKPQGVRTSLQKEPLMENNGPSMHGLFDTKYEFDSSDNLQEDVLGNP